MDFLSLLKMGENLFFDSISAFALTARQWF